MKGEVIIPESAVSLPGKMPRKWKLVSNNNSAPLTSHIKATIRKGMSMLSNSLFFSASE
jgi:hypothetical protein